MLGRPRRRPPVGLLAALLGLTVAGCDAGNQRASVPAARPAQAAIVVTDDAGRAVRLPGPARRVVSLIPSVTETLVALGAGPAIVGRTNYDVAPEVAALPSVGGGIDPSLEAIVALRPDLVITWEHDKRQQTRTKLDAAGIPTFSLRTEDTTDVFRGLARIGRLVGHELRAAALAAEIRRDLDAVRASVAGRPRRSVFYVVYNDPPMTAGPGTFIAQLIGVAGGRPTFDDVSQLWPTVAIEEIVRRQPDVIVLPVGEFRANAVERLRTAPGWRDLRAVREGRVATVPANLLNRPGANLGEAARVLRAAIHPDAPLSVARDSTARVR
jgi:iron complex transport system substrate-binding protein